MRLIRRYLAWVIITTMVCSPTISTAGSAISVPPEARDTAAAALAASKEVQSAKQDKLDALNAAEYARKAEFEVADVEKQIAELEQTLNQRNAEAEQAELAAQAAEREMTEASANAAALREKAEQALAASEDGYRQADAVDASLQTRENTYQAWQNRRPSSAGPSTRRTETPGPSLEDTDELLKVEKEMREMEKSQREADQARQTNTPMVAAEEGPEAVDWSVADQAHARADYLNRVFQEADKQSEEADIIAEEKITAWDIANDKAAQAKLLTEDTRTALGSMRDYLVQAQKEAAQAKKDYEQLVRSQENPPGSYYGSIDVDYYRWQDEFGNSGYQFIQPIYIGYWQKDFSYSVSTAIVTSQNNTAGRDGRAGTMLTDTELFMVKRKENSQSIIDYSLGINIPTGKSALSWSERHARMNEDLVRLSEFGKGWQLTPGVAYTRKVNEEDMWTIGTSYTFSRAYDPTSDIPNDDITPGGEWRKFFRWQHAGQPWQLVAELIHTSTGSTKVANGDRWASGSTLEPRLTYNRALSPFKNLMFYYWLENQGANNTVPGDMSSGLIHYFGTMWSKKTNARHTFRATFDVMTTNGSRYAGIRNFFDTYGLPQYSSIDVDGRTKYTFGLGYDIEMAGNSKLSIDIQRFLMKDGPSNAGDPATKYTGFNFLMKYAKSF